MLVVDTEGWVKSPIVTLNPCGAIEHSPIATINAIVLHRTDSTTASSVLSAWQSKKEGAHFLISENGTIYQTASLIKQCWHVGKIYSKCRTTSSCSEEDAKAIEEILKRKNTNWGNKFRLITKRELDKSFPDRFPHNHDSLGIEIVGVMTKQSEIYELPSKVQRDSLFWLLDEVIATYSLTVKNVYAHGQIAHKDKNKSEGTASLKAYALYKQGAKQ